MDTVLLRTLWAACRDEQLEELRFLAAQGADVNGLPGWLTPLYWAATFGQIRTVEFLLEAGADVNARFGNGSTTLIETVQASNVTVRIHTEVVPLSSYVKTVQLLLAAGADINLKADATARWPQGYTARTIAKRSEILFLLEQGFV
jgi:ankyrin repeat protein